jgi:hypothetical protein
VKGFAYCEAIENACSIDQLLGTVERMDRDIGKSNGHILQKMYCFLNKIAEIRLPYLKRSAYQVQVLKDIHFLLKEGEELARDWEDSAKGGFTEAHRRYKRAIELAEYHLENYDLARKIESRFKELQDEMSKKLGERVDPVNPVTQLDSGLADELKSSQQQRQMSEVNDYSQDNSSRQENKPRDGYLKKVLRRVFKKKKKE